MAYESVILILFVIASAVAIVARRFDLPYTIALMAVGLVLGPMKLLHPPHLTQELVYSIFLPPLIFEAAIHLRASELLKNIWIVLILAVPGVVMATLLTAGVMIPVSTHLVHHIEVVTWSLGILFGAAVAATDPVAVGGVFKKMGAPRRLRILVEGESLLNDGTSIVVFVIAVQFIQGTLSSPQGAITDFFRIVGLGLIIGMLVGLAADAVMRHIHDAMVVITITTVAAFGSFLIAEHVGVSGVMSCVAAGLVCGEKSFSSALFPAIKIATETFWEYVAFAMNSLIFLLMGFAIDITRMVELWPAILIAFGAVVCARFMVVLATWMLFRPTRQRIPFAWSLVLGWGGLKGALSMVLAMSIPDSMAFKDTIVTLVFGVVLLSIFFQGLTMAPFMRFLKVALPVKGLGDYESLKARFVLLQNALEEIDRLFQKRLLTPKSARSLKEEFRNQLEEVSRELEKIQPDREAIVAEEILRTKRCLIIDQKAQLLEMYQTGSIGLEAYEKLKEELDARLLEIESLGA